MSRLSGFVEKGWGHELIFVTNDKYCGKILKFNEGAEFSMHFHKDKMETWYVLDGEFELIMINTSNARQYKRKLTAGDTHTNDPLEPHQIKCIEAGKIIEISTPDSVEDNYRVIPGDSQKLS